MKLILHPTDHFVIYKLSKLGRKTKLQLMSMGFNKHIIEKLVDLGILVIVSDSLTNLQYYKVSDDYACV